MGRSEDQGTLGGGGPRWIRDAQALQGLAQTLRGSRTLALDTESDSLHHYAEKVCLVQLAAEGGATYLVDPLASRDLSPLAPLMADPATVKVLHGADYDVTTLKRDFGFTFSSLFDTMVAARFLGMPEVGLQAVARTELGVSLSKDSQRDDWSRRPLTPKQEAYAAADVAHLIALHERLDAKLEALGRRAWVREECDAVAALAPSRRDRDPDAFLRVKGANRLSPESLRIFANLYGWREGLGAEADVPTFKIVGNSTLLDLATARPKTPEDLGKIKGLPPRLRERGLLDVIRKASAEPPITPPRRPREVPTDAERARNEALRAWRAEAAKGLGLDVSAVLPQRLIDRLAKENPSTAGGLEGVEGLRRWRIQTFGTRILEKLAAARPS